VRLLFDPLGLVRFGWMVNLRLGGALRGKQMTVGWEERGE
jgi:hypothetical protein